MKNKDKLGIKIYLYWPLLLSGLIVIVDVCIFLVDIQAGFILSFFSIIYIIISIFIYLGSRPKLVNEIVQFTTGYAKSQENLLLELSIPYCILDTNGKIAWANHRFMEEVGQDNVTSKKISSFFPEIKEEKFRIEDDVLNIEIQYENKSYRAELKRLLMEDSTGENALLDLPEQGSFISLFLFDETDVKNLRKENLEQRFVAGMIYIDNYEEVLESIEDVRQSLLVGLIDRRINKYFTSIDGIVRKLEKDKYFIAFKQRYAAGLQSSKFSIIDEVKAVNIGNEMPITISIGLGLNGESYSKTCEYSRTAIDLALGRGGDQAVIKDGDKIYYYGGKSKQVEKNTRVKARVKAHALRELLLSKDKVIIMGHKLGDIDSFGASIGIYRICQILDRKAYIVINEITSSLRPILERFTSDDTYGEDMLISNEEAIDIVDDSTALVIVDVNRPSYVECTELIGLSKATVVLDHHRQSHEIIENAVLSYIEPFASSACEMVAEILQYISDSVKIRQVEADALYAGIMIDTDYFTNKTGVRTFEAAAFLKRSGADVTRVRKLFRDDLEDYKARAQTIFNAEVFLDSFVIAECPSEDIDSPTVVAAQAANEMLNINGIKSSFVVTEYNNKIYISARSIDDINVQLVMERLGGGGHLNTAGAQLEDCTIQEAKRIIKETVAKMLEEGDL